ncbi:MAG: hypothetical protein HUJ25_14405 [Crocinitomicaceae bacterium]|nr:hypothetical protein [Crocinitomicaceae bacterium]
MARYLFSCLLILYVGYSFGQDSLGVDNKKSTYEHSPKKAVLWSIFPGAGQIYNEIGYRKVSNKKHRAWWKVPLIYGGLGVCGYYFWHNYSQSQLFKEEILFRRDNPDSTLHAELVNYTTESSLINGYGDLPGFDTYAKRRDIFIAATVGVYALNLIEAYVDGHFVTFDVSDDLSLRCMPVMFDKYSPGVSLRLNFL